MPVNLEYASGFSQRSLGEKAKMDRSDKILFHF